MNELYAVLTGLLLRIGIPILFTAGLVYLLGRLDENWQAEARRRQAGAGPMAGSQPACWEQKGCSAAQMAVCPARKSEQPCWQVFRENNGYLAQKCLDCQVFSSAPVPTIAQT